MEVVLDPIFGWLLLASDKKTGLDVFATKISDAIVLLQVQQPPLKDWVLHVLLASIVQVKDPGACSNERHDN